ncbi:MAG: hypothetical protein SGBAC_009862 [Bacillariaceae sp.]
MGVPSTNSSNYRPRASADDVSLDSATTNVDKNEKLSLQTPQIRNSGVKRTPRSAFATLRRPVLASSAPSASCDIRHRYLSKLGLAKGSAASPAPTPSRPCMEKNLSPVGVLKTAMSKPEVPIIKPSVTFQKQVSIRYIPDKRQFENPEDLWIQKEEFTALHQRNCLEYAADGWNWENATEESDFVLFQNELVHPAHFSFQNEPVHTAHLRGQQTCNIQRQFLMTMYAQRQSEF